MNKIGLSNFAKNLTVIKCDVVSLLTNAPLAEAIDVIVKKMYNAITDNNDYAIPPIKPKILQS